ncbi:MAG: M1 family metallopeptidase [Bryobacteraceae bacterium]
MRRSLILSWLVCAASLSALPSPPSFLLPDDVVPRKYIADLTIDPSQPIFDGWVSIEVDLRKSVNVVWLNGKDLIPREAVIEFAGQSYPARAETAGGEFIGLALDSPVGPGRATLSIRYQGRIDDQALVGLYRRKVENEWYAFTTFTPIEARRAFPCFDEPRFKTPWELTLHVRRDQRAFSNASALRETEEPDGMKAIQFAPTEPLPSELVAFAIGPFDVFQGVPAGQDTPIRVITPKGHAADGEPAAKTTVDVLPRLEAYTGIPYPFGKLDHVALPEGAYGAVENPGLITYLSRVLLIPPGQGTPEKDRAIRSLEAHEIGHQWFGDLVTQATWEDVWLSEGFATWISGKMMDEEQPATRKNLGAVASRERIMTVDAGPRTRPVRLAMKSREDLQRLYVPLVYDKGASILLMLEGWLGEGHVRDGLRAYLNEHRFGNATTADLEADLSKAAGMDPAKVMDSFLDQTGIPSIHGDVRCEPGATPRIEIEQTASPHTWTLPVCWKADGLAQTCTVLDAPWQEIELPRDAACPAWIFLNAGGTGYYRTEWTGPQATALAEHGLAELTPAERLTLLYDLRALPQAGRMDAFPMFLKLAADPEPEIAKAASDTLQGK